MVKVSDYIAQRLAEAGIRNVFLVQGSSNNDIIYSLADRKDIRYICPMHEQSASFMAEGAAKVSGVPGCAISTSGPGGQNLLTGICNFYYDSVPGIFITGQVNSQFTRPSKRLRQVGFQEWPASDVFKHVTKYSAEVRDPRNIRKELDVALWCCTEGRPGPVHLDIPIDVQRAQIEPDTLLSYIPPRTIINDISKKIREFIEDFKKAKRPLVLIGGGIQSNTLASYYLDVLAEMLKIPLIPTWNALDVVTSDHKWYGGRTGTYGGPGRNLAIQNCDLLLCIGTRLSGRITGGNIQSFARGANRYVVDVDEALLETSLQQLPFHVNIQCDAKEFMQTLERALRYHITEAHIMPDHSEWCHQVFAWRDKYDPVKPEHYASKVVHPYAFARILSDMLLHNSVIVYDCGGNAVVMNHAFQTKKGQKYFSNNGNSPMGFSFCAAIGAWLADPTREIICIIGDGGFNMNIQELALVKSMGIKIKVFILNNGIYGITQQFQDTHFGGRHEASGPTCGYNPPNFRRVAEAYGVKTAWIETMKEAPKVIQKVLERDESVICDVVCDGYKTYEPRIAGWATPIEDMTPLLPREEFRKNMIVEPLPGWEKGEYGPYHK